MPPWTFPSGFEKLAMPSISSLPSANVPPALASVRDLASLTINEPAEREPTVDVVMHQPRFGSDQGPGRRHAPTTS